MDRLPLRLSRESSMFVLGGVVSLVGLALTSVVAARAMGPDDFSSYAAMVSLLGVLGTGVAAAMEQESARRVASRVGGESAELPIGPAAWATVVAGLLVLIPAGWQDLLFAGHRLVASLLLVVGIAAVHVGSVARGVLAGAGHRGRLGLAIALTGTLPVLVGALLTACGLDPFVAFGLGMVVAAASSVLVAVPELSSVRRGVRGSRPGQSAWFVAGLVAGNVFLTANMVGVPAVLRLHVHDLSASVVASLQIAVSLSRLSTLLVANAVSVVVAAALRKPRGGNIPRAVAGAVALGALAALGTGLLAPYLLPLVFGSQFQIDHWLALLAGLSVVFLNPAYVLTGVAVARRSMALIAVAWGGGAAVLAAVATWPGTATPTLVLAGITVASSVPAVVLALRLASAPPQLAE